MSVADLKQCITVLGCLLCCLLACSSSGSSGSPETDDDDLHPVVPHEGQWGIYALNIVDRSVEVVYSTDAEIHGSALRLSPDGTQFAFAQTFDGDGQEDFELCTLSVDGRGLRRLTENDVMDVYPAWSPDGTQIAYLSMRQTLDIRIVDVGGGNDRLLYDSGDHDGDVHWSQNQLVFTQGYRIWRMDPDGTNPVAVTDPADAGTWGRSNLPIGDYDPNLSPDGMTIAFERLEDVDTTHGGYNFFTIQLDGSDESRLTGDFYAQGLPTWSPTGASLLYLVSAIGEAGVYRIFQINTDGTGRQKITPEYFPPDFLCHSAIFGPGEQNVYFIGQWWN